MPAATAVVAGIGGGVLWSGEAAAANTIPGVGTVVKKHPGPQPITRGVTNKDGVFTARNLKPGDYEVIVGKNAPQSFTVSPGMRGIRILVTGTKESYVGQITPLR